jgi:integrase
MSLSSTGRIKKLQVVIAALTRLVRPLGRGTPPVLFYAILQIKTTFKALLRRAGLPDKEIRFHDLRHSATTFLIARGSDPKTVQAILGHTTVRLTIHTYVHAMPRRSAMRRSQWT